MPARWVLRAVAAALALLVVAALALLVPWAWEALGDGYAESAVLALGAAAVALWFSLRAHWRNLFAALLWLLLALLALLVWTGLL